MNPVREYFYWIDLAIGFSAPMVVLFLYAVKKIGRYTVALFWIGAVLGLTWEVPIFLLSVPPTAHPVITYIRPQPVHYLFFLAAHTLWDGGLFLIGVWLVRKLCRPPHFAGFRLSELGILIVYGQVSELIVELTSITNGGWAYVAGYRYNPVLFPVGRYHITLLPQLIWLAAPVVFYFAALALKRSGE